MLRNSQSCLLTVVLSYKLSVSSCFQHFFLNNSVTLDIIELIFGNGCPNAIFEHVFEKKEEQIR